TRRIRGHLLALQSEDRSIQQFSSFNRPPNVQLDAATAALLDETIMVQSRALALARHLESMPHGRYPFTLAPIPLDTYLVAQSQPWKLVELLHHDALNHAQKGDLTAAFQSCRAALNAARSIGDEPFVHSQSHRVENVSCICATAERVLAQGEANEADLAALQR